LKEISKIIWEKASWSVNVKEKQSIITWFKSTHTPEEQIDYISKNQEAILEGLWV